MLKRNHKGQALVVEMPRRVELMELASQDLFATLGKLSVDQLKALRPTGPYVPLIDALIAVRTLMGDE